MLPKWQMEIIDKAMKKHVEEICQSLVIQCEGYSIMTEQEMIDQKDDLAWHLMYMVNKKMFMEVIQDESRQDEFKTLIIQKVFQYI